MELLEICADRDHADLVGRASGLTSRVIAFLDGNESQQQRYTLLQKIFEM